MSTQIEMTDHERARYRGGHIVWLMVFFIALVVGFGTYNTTVYLLDR